MAEEFKPPTYDEYLKATDFARLRYKWGMFITLCAVVCLLVLIFFVYTYANELRSEPLNYAAEKYDAQCTCYTDEYKYEFNATQTYATPLEEAEWFNPLFEVNLEP